MSESEFRCGELAKSASENVLSGLCDCSILYVFTKAHVGGCVVGSRGAVFSIAQWSLVRFFTYGRRVFL